MLRRTLPMQCLEEFVFTPTVKDVLFKYMDGMMSVLLRLCGIFENLTRHAAQHAQSMTTWQRVLGQMSRKPSLEQMRPILEHLSIAPFPFLFLHRLSIATIVPVHMQG